jgi:uncharacterized FlaG/YvyC family protein
MTNSIEPISFGTGTSESRAVNQMAAADELRRHEAAPVEAEKAAAAAPAQGQARQLHPRFKVDPDTQQVTVLLLDPDTKRVVRTIPAEELKNVAEGELFEMLA